MKPLTGHISEETAFVVEDYPYGFTLRCKIRYWVESNPKHGFRSCSQTTNPKKSYEHWNKPKKSTYSKIAEGMYLNEENHVKFCGLSHYSGLQDSIEFKEKFGACLNQDALDSLNRWIFLKTQYNEACKRGEVSYTIGHKSGLIEGEDIDTSAGDQALTELKQKRA